MNVINLTPRQLVARNARAWANRGPDGRHDTGTTIVVQIDGEPPEEFGDFIAEAMILRIPERLRDTCKLHGRRPHWIDRTCTCACIFRSQLINAVMTVKANIKRKAGSPC